MAPYEGRGCKEVVVVAVGVEVNVTLESLDLILISTCVLGNPQATYLSFMHSFEVCKIIMFCPNLKQPGTV